MERPHPAMDKFRWLQRFTTFAVPCSPADWVAGRTLELIDDPCVSTVQLEEAGRLDFCGWLLTGSPLSPFGLLPRYELGDDSGELRGEILGDAR